MVSHVKEAEKKLVKKLRGFDRIYCFRGKKKEMGLRNSIWATAFAKNKREMALRGFDHRYWFHEIRKGNGGKGIWTCELEVNEEKSN